MVPLQRVTFSNISTRTGVVSCSLALMKHLHVTVLPRCFLNGQWAVDTSVVLLSAASDTRKSTPNGRGATQSTGFRLLKPSQSRTNLLAGELEKMRPHRYQGQRESWYPTAWRTATLHLILANLSSKSSLLRQGISKLQDKPRPLQLGTCQWKCVEQESSTQSNLDQRFPAVASCTAWRISRVSRAIERYRFVSHFVIVHRGSRSMISGLISSVIDEM